MFRLWMTVAGVLGAIGVAVAAWSAHGLAHLVAPHDLPLALDRARSASLFHLLHVLALFGVALGSRPNGSFWLNVAGTLFVLGILGFAGGIYVLRLIAGVDSGPLTNVVPFGGVCFILGWLAVAVAGWRMTSSVGS